MKKLLLAVFAFALVGVASAQAPDTTPPKELGELSWLHGTWKGTGAFNFGGMEIEVATKMAVSMDGQFIKFVSTNDYGMIQATETMMLGWDAAKSMYVSYAFSNLSPMPRREAGKKEGDSFVMISDPWEIMGQAMVSRSTMTKMSDTKVKFMLEFKAGDAWEKASEMELTKE